MVPLAGSRHCFVNVLYRAVRAPDTEVFKVAGRMPLQIFDRRPAALPPADCKLSVSELWRPATVTRVSRLMCRECIRWPAKIWTTVGPTVWLNGALLLTVAQNGFGIINSRRGSRPRYAKLKMEGVKLATPQPAPLSHTLWSDVATVKTVRDLKVVDHSGDAAFDNRGVALKEAEKAAAKFGAVVWKEPRIYCNGKVTVINPNRCSTIAVVKQLSLPIERLDWRAAFFARWNAGGDHPFTERVVVRQPGVGPYSPIWYRQRHWCEGAEGPVMDVVYLSHLDHSRRQAIGTRWPFEYMRSRGVGQDLYDVGVKHRSYWATGRRAVFDGARAALEKRQALTGVPIVEVVERVLLRNASISGLQHLSKRRNNTLASAEIMNVLRDGLQVLAAFYVGVGDWQETSWQVSEWADTCFVDADGFEANVFEAAWPQHWTRFLREHKYREEQENREYREHVGQLI